jgi:flagellin-like protein
MSQMSTPGSGLSRASGESDIYTALILVAFLFVLTATIYVGYRAQTLFGTLLPPAGS